MDELLSRVWHDLIGRLTGAMQFRLVLQPLAAIIYASRAAKKDAREGNPPFLSALFTNAVERRKLMQSGWRDVGRVFIFAILMDAIYQVIVVRRVYPGEMVIVAFLLAIVPYLLVRGPLNRILSRGK